MNLLHYYLVKYKNHISNIVTVLFVLTPILGVIYFFIDIRVSVVLISIFMATALYLKKNNKKLDTGLTQRGWDRAILTVISFLLLFGAILSLFMNSQYTVVFLILALFSYLQASSMPKHDLEVEKFLEDLKHDPDYNRELIDESIVKMINDIDTSIKKNTKDRFDVDESK